MLVVDIAIDQIEPGERRRQDMGDIPVRKTRFKRLRVARVPDASMQPIHKEEKMTIKTLDDKGLPVWGQLPLLTADGEMVWERRTNMKLEGYAWNYILRDDVAIKNQIIAGRWRSEALERWSADEFDTEAERLREEREDAQGAV